MRDLPEQSVSDIPKRKDSHRCSDNPPKGSDPVVPEEPKVPVVPEEPKVPVVPVEPPVPVQPDVVPEDCEDDKYDVKIEDVLHVIHSMGHNLDFEMSDDLEKQLCEMFAGFVE